MMTISDFTCPACGEEVYPNSKACPNCGTQPENGWATGGETIHQDAEVPEVEFDYKDFVSREFDRAGNLREKPQLAKIWVITAFVLFATLLILTLSGLW